MKSEKLLEALEFHDDVPYAQPLLVDQYSRILRFMLKPGQEVKAHQVPTSPFYVVILKGRGIFTDGKGEEGEYGPNDMLIFDKDEKHSVRALNEELIFIGFLHGVETMRPNRTGGELGRK
ncbi:hypothetical protein MASR2M15_11110 [Anaerolineales bacterium]